MSTELTDGQLAQLLAKGKPTRAIVEEAYRRFVPRMIVRAARRLGATFGHAEDVAQETFAKVLLRGSLAHLNDPNLVVQYLAVATDRATTDLLRSLGHEATVDSFERTPEVEVDDEPVAAMRSRVEEVLNLLNPEDAEIIRLRFFEEARLSKIAERLMISYSAAGQRLSRAIRRARRVASSREENVGAPVKVVA